MTDDQRSGTRIPVELPVEVYWKSRKGRTRRVEGKTGNISGNGVFTRIPVRPPCNTSVKMKVLLPSNIAPGAVELRCDGRVIRWSRPGEARGMGATIDEYEFRPTRA